MAISTQRSSDNKRKATLVIGITQGSASAFGSSIGGVIIQMLNWRWIFFINLPIIFLSCYLVLQYLPYHKARAIRKLRVDWLGTMLMIVGLFSLTLSLIDMKNKGVHLEIVGLMLISCLGFLLFLLRERRITYPIIDFDLFKSSNFILATLGTILGQLLLVGFMVIMPTFFETIFHKTSFQAALLVTPATLMIFLISPLAGGLMRKIRPSYLLALGFVTISLGYLGLSSVSAPLDYTFYVICSIFIGVGYGMIVGPISVLSTMDFEGSRLTVSQSVIGVLRQLGTVLATTIFISSLTHNLSLAKKVTDYISSFTSLYLYAAPIGLILAVLFFLFPSKNSKDKNR